MYPVVFLLLPCEDSEDSDFLLQKPQASLQVPSGIVKIEPRASLMNIIHFRSKRALYRDKSELGITVE